MERTTKKHDNEFLICNEYNGRRAIEKLSTLEDILEKHDIDVEQLDNILTEYAEHKKIEKELGINLIESFKNGIDNFSDGYHTFNDLYNQRLILTATIVNLIPRRCWKTKRHEDGDECFGGGWFLVTIETPEGNYGYHYENKYWDLFKCKELEKAKHWDGYTDKDVGRLLSLTKEALE